MRRAASAERPWPAGRRGCPDLASSEEAPPPGGRGGGARVRGSVVGSLRHVEAVLVDLQSPDLRMLGMVPDLADF
jgi:hypothetical protein